MENQTGTTAGTPGTGATTSNGVGATDDVVDRVAARAHETIDRVAAKAGPAVEKLRESASTYREQLHAKADRLGALEEQWIDSARSYVREHPFTSLAVAAVASMVIAKIFSSSHHR